MRADAVPLRRVAQRAQFESGTFLEEGGQTLLAFDPGQRRCRLQVAVR